MPALVSVVSQVSLVILLLPANIAHPGLGEYMLFSNHFSLKVLTKYHGSFQSTIVNLVNGHLNNVKLGCFSDYLSVADKSLL